MSETIFDTPATELTITALTATRYHPARIAHRGRIEAAMMAATDVAYEAAKAASKTRCLAEMGEAALLSTYAGMTRRQARRQASVMRAAK